VTFEPPQLRRRAALVAVGLSSLLVGTPVPALAETPSPAPSAESSVGTTASPSATPTGTPAPTPTSATPIPTPTSPTPSPGGTAAPEATPAPGTVDGAGRDRPAAANPTLTLKVAASGSPVAGQFYQDIGRYGFSGTADGLADGAVLEIYRHSTTTTTWTRVAKAKVSGERYSASLPVQALGTFTFVTTTGGAPGSGDEVASAKVRVTVRNSTISLSKPAASVDSLKSPTLSGVVVPARAGVVVHVDVRRGTSYRLSTTAKTNAAGRFTVRFAYGKGHLASYAVRATHHAANRDRWEISGSRTVKRVAVLNAVATDTTAAEVEKTYRKGCPVGRSRLSTITMNFYGRDKLMHRGVLIVRSDLVTEIKAAFGRSLTARYPFAKMRNPNDYGGNDPRQMEANNTSGFNCRKVVGNPYAQSPHSYGIAIDVNTVQNPYRDGNGKWWPTNSKPYRDRTPLRKGMLGINSTLTKQLRSDDFFWGGLWSPGRDYQHFEYRP